VDRLCSEYPHMPAEMLLIEGRQWLSRITSMLDRRLTLDQHRELLSLSGWLAALVGCVEYDSTNRAAAEATRRAALSLGQDSGNAEVAAWAHEMRAWFALTRGDYRGVIAAADAGHAVAPNTSAAVQLHAQKAKAWARIGDRRQVEVALDQGRALLERLPIQRISTTTSPWIQPSGTSTPWTATGCLEEPTVATRRTAWLVHTPRKSFEPERMKQAPSDLP
jgi:hypothetical protein